MDAEALVGDVGLWAYAVVFLVILAEAVPIVGTLVPSQLFLIGVGFLSRAAGGLNPVLVALVAWAASWTAGLVSFALGRRWGHHFFDRLPRALRVKSERMREGLDFHLGKSLFVARFIGPPRAIAPPLAGCARSSWRRFLGWNALACFAWAAGMTLVGVLFGASYRHVERWLGPGAVLVALVGLVTYLVVQRFRGQKELDELSSEAEG